MNEKYGRDQRPGDNKNKKQPFFLIVIFCLIALIITTVIYGSTGLNTTEKISYSTFLDLVESDQVQEVNIDGDRIYITLTDESDFMGVDGETTLQQSITTRLLGRN